MRDQQWNAKITELKGKQGEIESDFPHIVHAYAIEIVRRFVVENVIYPPSMPFIYLLFFFAAQHHEKKEEKKKLP